MHESSTKTLDSNSVRIQFFRMGMPRSSVRARFLGLYQAQIRGLREAGAVAEFVEDQPRAEYDVTVVTPTPRVADIDTVVRCLDSPIVLYVPPASLWFQARVLRRIASRVLFAYGTFKSARTSHAYAQVNIPYYQLPFGTDPQMMRPLHTPKFYDVVFIGGLDHRRGYQPYIEPLLHHIPLDRSLYIGSGWERYGIPSQQVAYGPMVCLIYNSARLCLNFHSMEQTRGDDIQLDLNNRIFDLAACGCAQVCDNPLAVQSCFSQDEVVTAATPQEWVQRVFELLKMDDINLTRLGERARQRVIQDHTWRHRGDLMLRWIKQQYHLRKQHHTVRPSFWRRILGG